MKETIALAALILLPVLALAEKPKPSEDALRDLHSAKTIRITLGPGAQGSWEGGKPKSEPMKRFSDDPVMNTITYDSINLEKGTARCIGKEGADDVRVFLHPNGITFFLEKPGGHFVTTVFATREKGAKHAVTSRHVSLALLGGEDLPSQYYGNAEITERHK